MPNRLAVIKTLTQDVLGAQRWNGLKGECTSMPTADYDAVEEAMTSILERVTRAVDWPRLLQEAAWRHQHLHPDLEPDQRRQSPATGVCGDCLREALLAEDRGAPNWEDHPVTPLAAQKVDWPSVVAANLRHREAAHWHPYMPKHGS